MAIINMREQRATDDPADNLASDFRVAILKLARRIRSAQTYDLLVASRRSALVRIDEHGPLSPTRLAELEVIQPSAATRAIAELEQRGYVKKTRHPADGRGWVVEVTPLGRSIIGDFRSRREEKLVEWLQSLSDPERGVLLAALPIFDHLSNIVSPHDDARQDEFRTLNSDSGG